MKFQILVITLIALVSLSPLALAYQQQGGSILPIGEKWKELRERFQNDEQYRNTLREQVKNCIGSESAECLEIRENAREIARGVLNRVCTNNAGTLENLKLRIQENNKLSDEEKTELISVIDEHKAEFDEICAQVNDADATKMKEIASKLRSLIKELKIKYGISKDLLHLRRIGLVIQRAEHLETKLQSYIDNNQCNDTNGTQELIDSFKSKIAEARASYDESKALWQQFVDSVRQGNPNTEILRQAQEKKQAAQLELKEAHQILKEILVKLRECRIEPEEISQNNPE